MTGRQTFYFFNCLLDRERFSTSLKFKLFDMPEEMLLCEARIERIGNRSSAIYFYHNFRNSFQEELQSLCILTYADGIRLFLNSITDSENGVLSSCAEITAVGFKTVLAKGYEQIHELTDDVLQGMRETLLLAPVHNAAYLEAIGQFRALLSNASLIGVFETAFHHTIPLERRLYPVPYAWYQKYGFMRMGYHGASHAYIAQQTGKAGNAGRVISCHLGGSCSVCAIQDGKSVDTSFGFSLQTGVMHANRAGDTDPYVIPYLLQNHLSMEEILQGLSTGGGLLGLSGISNDLREVQAAADQGDERALLAIRVFVYDIIRYIGAFYAELGGLDQLVFTGGIGEHAHAIRSQVCHPLQHLGILLDEEKTAIAKAVSFLLPIPRFSSL